MISALDDMETVVRCIEFGAEDYLPKPFDPVLLRARIGACLEKKRLRDPEIEYLRNVDRVIAAAAAVETGEFDPGTIEQVAERRPTSWDDSHGSSERMAREVQAREQRLQQEVHQLRIEIDESQNQLARWRRSPRPTISGTCRARRTSCASDLTRDE